MESLQGQMKKGHPNCLPHRYREPRLTARELIVLNNTQR
jgi:hypothetical protein